MEEDQESAIVERNENLDDSEILEIANKRVPKVLENWNRQYEQVKEDLIFLSKEHWPESVKQARGVGRPCPVYDLISPYINRVKNETRENPPSGIVRRSDSAKDSYLAEALQGWVRNNESDSRASMHYEIASANQTACGLAWLVYGVEYKSPNSFDMRYTVESPEDPTCIAIDGTQQDGSDSTIGVYIKKIDKHIAESKYGVDVEANGVTRDTTLSANWVKNDQVNCMLIWKKFDEEATLVKAKDAFSGEIIVDWSDRLPPNTFIIESRKSSRPSVYHYIVIGNEVVHKQKWIGDMIPIVPVYGDTANHSYGMIKEGIVRKVMDAQREYNYYKALATETVALTPRQPLFVAAESVEGLEKDYKGLNTTPKDYVRFRAYSKTGQSLPAPIRQPLDSDSSGINSSLQLIQQTLGSIIGISDSPTGLSAVEQSGKAIIAKQKSSDRTNAQYYGNLAHAVARGVTIWIDMLVNSVQGEMVLNTIADNGDGGRVVIGTKEIKDENGKVLVYDIRKGQYDCIVNSGPSYASKRDEQAQALLEMLNATPESQKSAIFPAVIGAQDWPNAQKISKIALATLPPEIQKIYAEDQEEVEIPTQVRAILDQMTQAISEGEQEASALMEQVQALTEQNKMLAQDLQTTLLSKEQESQAKVSVALINAQSDLEVARINAGSKDKTTIIDSATQLELEQVKQDGESNRKQMDIATNIIGKAISGTQTAEIARPDGVGFPVSAGTLP